MKDIKDMPLSEKIEMGSGKSFWETKGKDEYGISSLWLSDGTNGLRKQDRDSGADMLGVNVSRPSTCFPSAVTLSNTWDKDCAEEVGRAIGEEARDQGVDIVLGPGINIKRNPLCGRNFEYYSEDPLLAGKLAAGFIRGLESTGVSSSLKHFAVNSQEKSRFNSNSVVDERTLREIYLRGFEIAVKEGHPSTVMSSYPLLNGIHCSDNAYLLDHILRKEWGFDGLVVTDWGGMNNRLEGYKAGCDLSMPGGSNYMEKDAQKAVERGELKEEYINKSLERLKKLSDKKKERKACDYSSHHELSQRVAEKGAVLLKNDDCILPLKKEDKIAIIGAMAKKMRYQGAGSSHVNALNVEEPLDSFPGIPYREGYSRTGETDDERIKEAVSIAKGKDKVIVYLGLPEKYESEGFDREDMLLPEGEVKLLDEIAKVNKNIVVVLMCGSAVECPFLDKIKGLLYMGLAGEATGKASYNLLYGIVNPSGKLSESWPIKYSDNISSSYYGKSKDAIYLEGIYVGYRYYDKAKVRVAFPFGYGLSYTSFKFSSLTIDGNRVSLEVKNIGETQGEEVVELYISGPKGRVHRPEKELRAFQKVSLLQNESKTISFELTDRDFSYWDNGWKIEKGEYTILVGDSSINLPLSVNTEKDGIVPPVSSPSWYDNPIGVPTQEEWEKMSGMNYAPMQLEKGHFTMDNTVVEMKDYSFIMKIMYKAIESTVAKGFGGKKDYNNPEFRMLMASSAGSPLRSMEISGGMKDGVMQGLLEMANGHYFRGIKRMITG